MIRVMKAPLSRVVRFWRSLGPGLTTGAADDDPSGIATYSQGGAQYGLQLIWLSLFTFPFMAVVQEMCARIGIVSGEGLAANMRKHYSMPTLSVVVMLLFIANIFNIAADLGAMAASMRLVAPGVSYGVFVIGFAVASLLLQVFTSYASYAKYLKYMTLALLSYVVVALAVGLDWGDVLKHTFIPSFHFSRSEFLLLGAVIGTTISPYLFFWQTSQEVEEGILKGEASIAARRHEATTSHVRAMRTDVWSGMFFSNLVSFFIFAACAGTLYAHGVTSIATADQAAQALAPFGQYASLFFTFGIIGTGLLAVPVLAGSTAYALAESFNWKYGLYQKWNEAGAFYGVIVISMVLGIVANFMRLDPIKSLIYAAILNGLIAPIILFFVVRLSGNKEVMGKFANSVLISAIGWITVLIMAAVAVAVLFAL